MLPLASVSYTDCSVLSVFQGKMSCFPKYAQVALALRRTLGIKVDDLESRSWGQSMDHVRVTSAACVEHTLSYHQNLSCFLLCSQIIKEHGQTSVCLMLCMSYTLTTSIYLGVSTHPFVLFQLQHQTGVIGVKISFVQQFLRSS